VLEGRDIQQQDRELMDKQVGRAVEDSPVAVDRTELQGKAGEDKAAEDRLGEGSQEVGSQGSTEADSL